MAKRKKSEDQSDEAAAPPPPSKAKASSPTDVLALFKSEAGKRWTKSLITASDIPKKNDAKISTGNFALDLATYGGYGRGRIIRHYGTPRSTKTGSALNAVAEFQKRCCHCFSLKACLCDDRGPAGVLWADLEGKLADDLMLPWMEGHGVKTEAMLLQRPDSGDEVIDLFDMAIRRGVGLMVCDSIAHMVSKAEISKAVEDGELPGRGAQHVNKAMRKWIIALTQRGFDDWDAIPTIILINQIRGTLDAYQPEALPGGKGQEFATSLDIRFHSTKSKWRYRSVKADGSFRDEKTPDVSGEMKEDVSPDYQEVDYRVTTSSICPSGRSGTFNYWLREAYGRRVGDPDNEATLWKYIKRYDGLKKTSGGYCLKVPDSFVRTDEERDEEYCHGEKHVDVAMAFRSDTTVQKMFWDLFIRELCKR